MAVGGVYLAQAAADLPAPALVGPPVLFQSEKVSRYDTYFSSTSTLYPQKLLRAVDTQNLTLAQAGKAMLHTWGDRDPRAQGIMHVLLDAFPVRPEYPYLKLLRQLPQTYFRDPGGGNRETLPRLACAACMGRRKRRGDDGVSQQAPFGGLRARGTAERPLRVTSIP